MAGGEQQKLPKQKPDLFALQPYYDSGVDSASNRSKYQKIFLEVERGRRVRLTVLPQSESIV
jgi:hypothetical protein